MQLIFKWLTSLRVMRRRKRHTYTQSTGHKKLMCSRRSEKSPTVSHGDTGKHFQPITTAFWVWHTSHLKSVFPTTILFLFKIHSLNVLPKNPHSDTEGWLLARTFWAALAKYGARYWKPKIPPLTAAPKPPWEVICRVWLWMAAAREDKVRRQRRRSGVEEGMRGGLNQCHPLQLSAKKDRCSLCLFVCAWGCMPAQTRINQELFSFKSISALTNLSLDQCKTECNTYWVKFKLNLKLNAYRSQRPTFFSVH